MTNTLLDFPLYLASTDTLWIAYMGSIHKIATTSGPLRASMIQEYLDLYKQHTSMLIRQK